MKRVVITGIGVVSPLGNNLNRFWSNIRQGKHGIRPISSFDTTDFPVKVAGEVPDFDPSLSMTRQELRKTDLYCQYALEAARQAIEDCGSRFKDCKAHRLGVYVGTGIGGMHTLEQEHDVFREKGARRVSPMAIPKLISNMASGLLSIRYGFHGPSFNISSACASSTNAVGEAFLALRDGRMDACLAGGTEACVTAYTLSGFANMRALTTSADPDRASIPFDKERSGFVMGEGAGVLVLEEMEHAVKRDAPIYAEIVGYGATSDAYHITSPDPSGESYAQAMRCACEDAGITTDQVDYINAHGTSTPMNDACETQAIKKAFGDRAKDLLISSTKSMTGHMLGAAGAVETIICAMALKDSFVPMTVGYRVPDEACDLNYVTGGGLQKDIQYALTNSAGFGGHNAVLCLRKFA
ncbi:MAG: beta-ketoacyl-ACP synthase II [Clostridiales bacterium]|nr:beta-ketoacyl-ACP synthase II [Clostridiales bacterium]